MACHPIRPQDAADGFSMMELLIVLLIIAIAAMAAYPSYLDQVRKSKRAVAKSALLEIANREEQYFFSHKAYTADLTQLGYSTSPVDFGEDHTPASLAADAVYTLSATVINSGSLTCGSASAPCFQLKATPKNDQVNDACGIFTLNSSNEQGVSGSASTCW